MTTVHCLPAWPSDLAETRGFQTAIAAVTDPTLPSGGGGGPSPSRLASGRFHVVADLGRGSMGVVVLAEDTLLGRRVAIKRLHPELIADTQHRGRLRNEARIVALLDHPGIVRVLDLVCNDGVDHIVMEYVAGPSLRMLRSRGALSIARATQIAWHLADALDHVHAQGIVHRDVKLENVLTTRDGHPKLNDFGIARSEECIDDGREVVGTPRAMSPEQITGEPVDRRSDLFSFGVLLYELVSGVSPFAAESHTQTMRRVLLHHPPSLAAELLDVPAQLAELVERLLDKDPLRRPQSASEVAVQLRAIRDTAEQ